MEKTHLSDLFKFVQGFGQKGHQIGRKIGDALELIVLGMIHRCPELAKHMVIENGIEGATTAKHKVEFGFYKLGTNQKPTAKIEDLFGMIECKKVGVEQTVKGSYKKWLASKPIKGKHFYDTAGFTFKQRVDAVEDAEDVEEPKAGEENFTLDEGGSKGDSRTITVAPAKVDGNLKITIAYRDASATAIDKIFTAAKGDKFLITIDTEKNFRLLSNEETLSSVETPLQSCVIITIVDVDASSGKIETIQIEDCLAGPQTPEKAKQASFVSLDVRKKMLGFFDKDVGRPGFTSILVIGEASHW